MLAFCGDIISFSLCLREKKPEFVHRIYRMDTDF